MFYIYIFRRLCIRIRVEKIEVEKNKEGSRIQRVKNITIILMSFGYYAKTQLTSMKFLQLHPTRAFWNRCRLKVVEAEIASRIQAFA